MDRSNCICKICKGKFWVKPSNLRRGMGTYCSRECQGVSKRGLPSWNKGRTMSLESREKMRQAQLRNPVRHWLGKERPKGPLAPRWKGGITPIKSVIRHSREWANWRTAVFQRDNYRCMDCGIEGYLEPHHIIPLKVAMEKVFEVTNGITLCRPCHRVTMGKELELASTYVSLVQARV